MACSGAVPTDTRKVRKKPEPAWGNVPPPGLLAFHLCEREDSHETRSHHRAGRAGRDTGLRRQREKEEDADASAGLLPGAARLALEPQLLWRQLSARPERLFAG